MQFLTSWYKLVGVGIVHPETASYKGADMDNVPHNTLAFLDNSKLFIYCSVMGKDINYPFQKCIVCLFMSIVSYLTNSF